MRLVGRLALVACIVLPVGCTKRPQPAPVVVVPPPSTLALEAANREFAAGEYLAASRDFERYLELMPVGGKRDHALFHLGLIYSLPDQTTQDWPRAAGYLKTVVEEYPLSAHKPAAQLILSMRDQATQLSMEIARLTVEGNQLRTEGMRLQDEVGKLKTDADLLQTNSIGLKEQIERLKQEAEQVALELNKRDQRIRQLNDQLDRLIKIDSERRTRP
ncbi:MAG TPA: hypothetical protein VFR18_02545 [Terriglobia bacterium]|nr:hypothetical protein [Terriglobia bacterium]